MTILQRDRKRLYREAERLAGRPEDLVQRAAVYHHLYEHSGGNHIFPLIAAHGALWGAGHFKRGMIVGEFMAWGRYPFSPDGRAAYRHDLETLGATLREINRRVCVETYVTYHLSALHGDHPDATDYIDPQVLPLLRAVHRARKTGVPLRPEQKRDLFRYFFFWEQNHVVGPDLEAAVGRMRYGSARFVTMKPPVRFAYFPFHHTLFFHHFENKAERNDKGLKAYDTAIRVGLERVENSLMNYGIMPKAFADNNVRFFQSYKAGLV